MLAGTVGSYSEPNGKVQTGNVQSLHEMAACFALAFKSGSWTRHKLYDYNSGLTTTKTGTRIQGKRPLSKTRQVQPTIWVLMAVEGIKYLEEGDRMWGVARLTSAQF